MPPGQAESYSNPRFYYILDERPDYRLTSAAHSIGNLRPTYCASETVYGGNEAIVLPDNTATPLPCDT